MSALLETFAFWVLEAACVLATGRLLSTTSAALLYAKFIPYCLLLTSVDLLYGIALLYCMMLYPYNLSIQYILKVLIDTVATMHCSTNVSLLRDMS